MRNEKEEGFQNLSQAKARTFDISSWRPFRPQPPRRRACSARFLPPNESTARKYSNRRASTRRRRRSPSRDVDRPSKFYLSLGVDRAETVWPSRFALAFRRLRAKRFERSKCSTRRLARAGRRTDFGRSRFRRRSRFRFQKFVSRSFIVSSVVWFRGEKVRGRFDARRSLSVEPLTTR